MMSQSVPPEALGAVAPANGKKMDELARLAPLPPDPEVEALRAVARALDGLEDPAARRRVLTWAQARFVDSPLVPPPRQVPPKV